MKYFNKFFNIKSKMTIHDEDDVEDEKIDNRKKMII